MIIKKEGVLKMNMKNLNPIEKIVNMVNGHFISDASKMITDLIKSKTIFTVTCDSRTTRLINRMVPKIFPRATQIVKVRPMQSSESKSPVIFEVSNNTGTNPVADGHASVDYIIYHGTPIMFHMSVLRDDDNLRSRRNGMQAPITKLSTIRSKTHIHNMKEFINNMVRAGMKIEREENKHSLINGTAGSFTYYTHEEDGYLNTRNFNNVFIPDSQKKQLQESIDKFIANRDWYIEKNIPYHFGILLYGPPGTGKSSIAQAIANYSNSQIINYPASNLSFLSHNIGNTVSIFPTHADDYRMLLVEDIDCGLLDGSQRQIGYEGRAEYNDDDNGLYIKNTNQRGSDLSGVLNALDGVLAPSNMFYVFTTNHIEKLDPALIRPGRIDLKLEIGYVTEETFKQFCEFHYGIIIKKHVAIIRKELTCAELQTLVMKGYTIEQLVEYVESEN